MVQPSHASSSILLRKRTSDAPRRRSGQLGAVKKAPADENVSPEPAAQTKAQPRTPEEAQPALPPVEPAAQAAEAEADPAAASEAGAAAPNGEAPTTRFQRLLVDSNAADRWFDDQLTPKSGAGGGGGKQGGGAAAARPVQSAASQIVDKALKYITSDRPAGGQGQKASNVFKLDSGSILDKGLDAIKGVANLMESFTNTLDGFIGQALEEWGTPKSAERPRPLQPHNSAGRQQRSARRDGKGAGTGARGTPALKQTHMTAFMSRVTDASEEDIAEWQKRAISLQAELQKLQSQIEENQRLREECMKMQQDLQQTTSAVSKLEEENSLLKQRTPQAPDTDVEAADPLAAEQVRLQMEALLAEKAKLAQENARLLRENTGLQELLEFTMMAQAELVGDDELFGDDQSWSAPASSYGGEASPCSTEGYASRTPSASTAELAL